MSLYDDVDSSGGREASVAAARGAGAGWSPGIRLLQSQLHLKRHQQQPNNKPKHNRPHQVLPPVIDLKSKRDDDDNIFPIQGQKIFHGVKTQPVSSKLREYDWDVVGEYDPMWPNDYEKTVKELRERRDRENDLNYDEKERKAHRKRKSRFGDSDDLPDKFMQSRHSEEEMERSPPSRSGGAAIAPPPSLQESEPTSPPNVHIPSLDKPEKSSSTGNYGGNSVAAKIMAKYGFKEGQGLGKKEQGMSMALQVEKTSKRGGRIIHEKDSSSMPPPPPLFGEDNSGSPPYEMGPPGSLGARSEPSITEIMKSPSKVVLLRNMVGPGDVDDELEPEVKDECNSKYGEVVKVVICEMPNAVPEEAVRIFVEFKRIESAIKAVVDLNGRFFGGRQVRAGFYSVEQFTNLQLLD